MNIHYPGEPGFEEARVGRVFNGRRPDRQPVAVLEAGSVEDVVAGVRLARDKGWPVSVRSGGHSWAAWSVRDGALLIDLGALRELSFDEATGIVIASPAIKGGDELSPFLEERGRFFNGGHCPSVGIGGFLLQGGQGWNQRGWGWGAESVLAVDVVTADGELVRADAAQNADLYWAARGAGPAFPGIVVRFHLATRPLFGYLGHTVQVYDTADFAEVMTWLYGIHGSVSTDVEIVAVGLTPPGETEPRLLVTAVALVDSREEAVAALAPFNTSPALARALMVQDCAESSLAEQRREQERSNPRGARYFADNAWVDGPVDEIVARLEPLFTTLPTPEAFCIWMSNAPQRPLPDMAFSLQTDAYVAAYSVFTDAADDARVRSWLDAVMAELQPVTAGQYLGDSDMTNRQLHFMADDNYSKLRAIMSDRDPQRRFMDYLAADPASVNRNHWE